MPRIAVVRPERCNPEGCGNYLCIRLCPVNRDGKPCITENKDNKKVRVDEQLCIGCQICVNKCPYDVFTIVNLPDELCKTPIHQYGKNGFHLYNLPAPVFGKSIGVLGRNGIGKSTAIKILAGVETPNLGKKEPATMKEVLEFFKGKESQNFFEKLSENKIKVSYKPQHVDALSKTVKGKVGELLRKVDETEKFEEATSQLQLKHLLENELSTLSGGELQRVAIAASVMKKADVYIFDEPTSYLDIKQRLAVANFINKLATENTSVLVVEHDLIILDTMTDLVHITYGEEGAYGIVSQPKTNRVGINVYLSGHLKEENMRFREGEIKFQRRPPAILQRGPDLVSWKGIQKQLGRFLLNAPEGEIKKGEIIGIVGENGMGKTSFVKILAKEIESDTGKLSEEVKVSYKPQYIENTSHNLVQDEIYEAVHRHEHDLIKPLSLKNLLQRRMKDLSGGELQRVAIAYALSQEADLYLLDEPSAYLDVEQRLTISKIVREFAEKKGKTILVVDHDLLFIDYVSDRLLVFTGQPGLTGTAKGPYKLEEGMNNFLRELNITFRRDAESNRPRANKEGSRLDQEQKKKNNYYYS